MKQRCRWCNKAGPDLKEVVLTTLDRFAIKRVERSYLVHPEHEQDLARFNDLGLKYGRLFLTLVAVSIAAFMVLEVGLLQVHRAAAILGAGAVVILLGAGVIAMPFATPETVALFGLRTSIILVRACGCVAVGLGIFIALQAVA